MSTPVAPVRSPFPLRAALLLLTVCGAMLAGMLLSWKLWLPPPARTYPLVPFWDGLPAIHPWLGEAWLSALLALIVLVPVTVFLPWGRSVLWLFVGLAVLLIQWDQTRLQPWVYQYLVMLVCLGFYPWRSS